MWGHSNHPGRYPAGLCGDMEMLGGQLKPQAQNMAWNRVLATASGGQPPGEAELRPISGFQLEIHLGRGSACLPRPPPPSPVPKPPSNQGPSPGQSKAGCEAWGRPTSGAGTVKQPPWKAHLPLVVTFPLRRTVAQMLPKCRSRTVFGQTPPPAGRRGGCGLRAEPAASHSAAGYSARSPPPGS